MAHRVVHLIAGLGKGGAETMLYQILKYQSDFTIMYSVITLGASHYYEVPIRALGVDLVECSIREHPLQTLCCILQKLRHADTLCCWMYHANFLGYMLGKLTQVKNIVWCIRHSNLDSRLNKKSTLRINRYCAKWSRNVAAIAYNGNRAKSVHEKNGYSCGKGVVLDNGCDCVEYAPLLGAKARLQAELHLLSEKKIILSVTKDHPIKDVPIFLAAFGELHKEQPNTVAVLCGMGIELSNKQLVAQCEKNNLTIGVDVFMLGLRHDVPVLLAACDLYVLHSAGEAFPNALLQAMSCGCLCLTTDVGDARRILNQDDCVVMAGDASALCRGMRMQLSLPEDVKSKIKMQNRSRALKQFNICQVVKHYEELLKCERNMSDEAK